MVDVLQKGITGVNAEKALEDCGIVVNKNRIPYDQKPPSITSGHPAGNQRPRHPQHGAGRHGRVRGPRPRGADLARAEGRQGIRARSRTAGLGRGARSSHLRAPSHQHVPPRRRKTEGSNHAPPVPPNGSHCCGSSSQRRASRRVRGPGSRGGATTADAPLSFGQRRLWFLDQFEPGTSLYNDTFALTVNGVELDVAAFERAFAEIVRRHDALRTSFHLSAAEPVQRAHADLEVPLAVVDVRGEADPGAACRARLLADCRAPFVLDRAPLARARCWPEPRTRAGCSV